MSSDLAILQCRGLYYDMYLLDNNSANAWKMVENREHTLTLGSQDSWGFFCLPPTKTGRKREVKKRLKQFEPNTLTYIIN